MSRRVVIDGENGWLNLRAAIIYWGEEPGPGDTEGVAPVQLRWMIHPEIGLPLQHFYVWRRTVPGGNPSKQQLVEMDDWELVETVGLPTTDDWGDTNYSQDWQGLPGEEAEAREAAYRRLKRGAPRKGWMPTTASGHVPTAWERADEGRFLSHLSDGHIMQGLHKMLLEEPAPRKHRFFPVEINQSNPSDLLPHLLLNDVIGSVTGNDQPRGKWHPLSLLLMNAGSDPLAALALGFGTAIDTQYPGEELYMVTVRHELDPGSGNQIELADIAYPAGLFERVPTPTGLVTKRSKVTRPQRLEGSSMETVGVSWDRPVKPTAQPLFAPEKPFAVSYVIARFGSPPEGILLTYRDYAGGWASYVPSTSRDDEPIAFQDHAYRTTNGTGSGNPYPRDLGFTYAVAGQDLFGRWSEWEETGHSIPDEDPQGPSILSVQLDNDGVLTVDYAWDWSDRSPQFIELTGAWTDDPGNILASARIEHEGTNKGEAEGAHVVPLSPDKLPTQWGQAQDKNELEPATRFYRWTTQVPLNFNGARWREFGVQSRGQRFLHFRPNDNFGISPWTAPVKARVWDDQPLPLPFVEPAEAPFWASLPDAAGVSRFTLNWPGVPNAAGYLVYEATETALLSANNMPGPDTAVAYHVRLDALRNADIHGKQRTFRRLTEQPVEGTSYEVTLPRGSKVIHFFAITTISANQIEGRWPNDNEMFVAVAVPRLNLPPTPGIAVAPLPDAPQQVAVTVDLNGSAGGRVELYRTNIEAAARDVGSMGPALVTLNATGGTVQFTDTPTPGWHRHHYRAVAWSARDDLRGLVEARSAASPAVSILVAPSDGPAVVNLRVNQDGSTDAESLLSWESDVPLAVTPLGPHTTALQTADAAGSVVIRLSGRVDALASIPSPADLPPPDPARRAILRCGGNGAPPRFYAWAPRPAPDQPFHATVAMIDPLGRVGRAEADVPPMPSGPQLGPVAITPLAPPHFPPPRRFSVSWDIPMEIPAEQLGHYTLTVMVVMDLGPGGFSVQRTLAQAPEVADPAQFTGFRQIARLAGQQSYFLFLRATPRPAQAIVTLTDPLGRSVQQTGTLE